MEIKFNYVEMDSKLNLVFQCLIVYQISKLYFFKQLVWQGSKGIILGMRRLGVDRGFVINYSTV